MDSVSIAASFAATSQAQLGSAIQVEMMKMAAAQQQNVASLLEAGAQNLEAVASAPPPGLGNAVDVTA